MKASQVISLRLDPDVAASLREVANQRGVTVSDLLRQAVERIVGFYEDVQPATEVLAAFEAVVERSLTGVTTVLPRQSTAWGCRHLTMSGPTLCAPTAGCGCLTRRW